MAHQQRPDTPISVMSSLILTELNACNVIYMDKKIHVIRGISGESIIMTILALLVFDLSTCSPMGPGAPGNPLDPSSPLAPNGPCWPLGPSSPSAPYTTEEELRLGDGHQNTIIMIVIFHDDN